MRLPFYGLSVGQQHVLSSHSVICSFRETRPNIIIPASDLKGLLSFQPTTKDRLYLNLGYNDPLISLIKTLL